jgi:hypothetical protein
MVRPPEAAEVAALAFWDDLLRAYAETLELQRAYLLSLGSLDAADDALLGTPSIELPADAPPMPESMQAWAMSLLAETAGLTQLATQLLGDRPVERRPQRFQASAGGSVLDQKI